MIYMSNHENHSNHNLSVRGGTVHCDDCREALHDHPDTVTHRWNSVTQTWQAK